MSYFFAPISLQHFCTLTDVDMLGDFELFLNGENKHFGKGANPNCWGVAVGDVYEYENFSILVKSDTQILIFKQRLKIQVKLKAFLAGKSTFENNFKDAFDAPRQYWQKSPISENDIIWSAISQLSFNKSK